MGLSQEEKYGSTWTRDELTLALYLYCQIPFAQTKANNPAVIRLAEVIARTPSAVARKLGNFGAFDPLLAQKGIKGLTHFSAGDQTIWNEYQGHWSRLVDDSQHILSVLKATLYSEEQPKEDTPSQQPDLILPTGPSDKARVVMTRLYQSFFRRSVLSSYTNACCLCGLDLPELLVASHIIPWSLSVETRTDPQNGLCLCALHDKAFDRGLISISVQYEVVVSSRVKRSSVAFVTDSIAAFEKRRIILPQRFAPRSVFLQWHLSHVFKH